MAISRRRLPIWLRPETKVFLNNLLRCQNISDNPAKTGPLHEYNPVPGCIPTRTIKLCQEQSSQDFISLLCMCTKPFFCNENNEDKIFSFASKTFQLGDKDKEKSFEESNTKKEELKITWIIQKIKELKQSAFDVDSDYVSRFWHCAETYAIHQLFRNFFLTKPGPQGTAWLPLCGVAIRLDGIRAVEFTFESIVGIENISDQQKTGALSDPCHNCKALLRFHGQSLTSFDLLFPLRPQFLKNIDGNLVKIEKEKGGSKYYRREHSNSKIEVPKDCQGRPVKLKLGGDSAPVKGEYMTYPAFLRNHT